MARIKDIRILCRIRLTFEVPGVNPDDVHISVENGVLTVSGEKKYARETGDEKKGTRSVERRYGRPILSGFHAAFSHSPLTPRRSRHAMTTAC